MSGPNERPDPPPFTAGIAPPQRSPEDPPVATELGGGSLLQSEYPHSPTVAWRWPWEVAQYITDVAITALMYLKLPLALLLAIVIGGLGVIGLFRILVSVAHDSFASIIHSSTQTAKGSVGSILEFARGLKDIVERLMPFNMTAVGSQGVLCALPLLALCNPQTVVVGDILSDPDYPTLMDVQGRAFDHLLGQSETGITISLDIKYAEIAVRDLVVIVRASDLINKDLVATALDDFVLDARLAGRALQKLSVKIYSSTDNIIAFNDYALRALKATGPPATTVATTTLARVFQSLTSTLANEVADILVQAAKTVTSLDMLENQLVRIHAASVDDHILTAAAIDTILSELWTKLGGNGQRLRDLERRAKVLKNLDAYRRRAVAHVAVTVQTLVGIEEELNQLMRKLRHDEVNTQFGLPLEAHIASIDGGVKRLREERMKVRMASFAKETIADASMHLSVSRT